MISLFGSETVLTTGHEPFLIGKVIYDTLVKNGLGDTLFLSDFLYGLDIVFCLGLIFTIISIPLVELTYQWKMKHKDDLEDSTKQIKEAKAFRKNGYKGNIIIFAILCLAPVIIQTLVGVIM